MYSEGTCRVRIKVLSDFTSLLAKVVVAVFNYQEGG